MASLSAYGVTHPPRSNPPLRSSSAPPSPCITPSTVTIVRVVSFMVAVPFSLGLVVVRFHRTAAPTSSVAPGPVRPIHPAPGPNTAEEPCRPLSGGADSPAELGRTGGPGPAQPAKGTV